MWKARDLTSLSPCSNCSFFILLVCWWHNFNSSKILYSDNSRWELTFAVCIWNVRPVDGFIMIHLREWSLGPNLRELGLVASISGDMCAPRDRTMAQYPHPLKKGTMIWMSMDPQLRGYSRDRLPFFFWWIKGPTWRTGFGSLFGP